MSEIYPTVSIIMNCYNSDRYLKEALDSVYAQSFSNWEIIFWDNASTDSSGKIAQAYDHRVKYNRVSETTQLGLARNLAMKEASGKYIAFLDCDDLYLPDKLEKQVRLMDKKGYVFCYGSAITIDELGDEIRSSPVNNNSGYLFGELLKRYEINMQSVMIRRDILENEDLQFETNLQYCPDYNLFMEIASRYPIGVIKDFIVKYRLVNGSLSKRTIDLVSKENKFTLDRIFNRTPDLKRRYFNEARDAYAKLHYYDAVAAVYRDDYPGARNELLKIILNRWQYSILYILLLFPVPNSLILRVLRR